MTLNTDINRENFAAKSRTGQQKISSGKRKDNRRGLTRKSRLAERIITPKRGKTRRREVSVWP